MITLVTGLVLSCRLVHMQPDYYKAEIKFNDKNADLKLSHLYYGLVTDYNYKLRKIGEEFHGKNIKNGNLVLRNIHRDKSSYTFELVSEKSGLLDMICLEKK